MPDLRIIPKDERPSFLEFAKEQAEAVADQFGIPRTFIRKGASCGPTQVDIDRVNKEPTK